MESWGEIERLKDFESGNEEIRIGENAAQVAQEGAALFAELSRQAIRERGRFAVLLSGGNTPRPMYERISGLELDWERIHLFWGDERFVPLDDPASNFRMAREAWLSRVPIPEESIHRVPTELGDPPEVARAYEEEIRTFFRGEGPGEFPGFDLAIQGVGTDGHTASLFPDSLTEPDQPSWVIAPYVEKLGQFRISVTLGVLNSARFVLFLAVGREKAEIISRITRRDHSHQGLLPSERVHPRAGRLLWLLDRGAASEIRVRKVS